MTIEDIRGKIEKGEYRFSDHAVKRMIQKSIDRYEVEDVIFGGEVIEEYTRGQIFPKLSYLRQNRKGKKFTRPNIISSYGCDYYNLRT
jgi:hypothetical protein